MATTMINRTPGRAGPPPDGAAASGSVPDTSSSMSLPQLQDLMRSITDGDGDGDDHATRFSNLLSRLGGGGASAYASASVGLDRLA